MLRKFQGEPLKPDPRLCVLSDFLPHDLCHGRDSSRWLSAKKSPSFPSSSRDEGPFPCFFEKGIPAFPPHLKRRWSQREPREELQGSGHHSKRPRCPNPLQIHLTLLHWFDGHPEDRLKTRCQMWQPEKANNPYVNSTGSLPLLFQLERKADLHACTWDEAWLPCGNSGGTSRSMSALERNPEVLASTPDEDLGPSSDCRGILRGPSQLAWRLDFLEATRVNPWGPCHNSRGTPCFLLQVEENFCCGISREIPPSLLSLKRVLYTLEETQAVPRHNHLHSRGTPRVSPQLKKSPGFPSSSRDESPFPSFIGRGIPVFLSHLKRKWSQLESREELQGLPEFQKNPMSQSTPDTPDSPALSQWSPWGSTQNTMAGVTALCHLERKPLIPMSTGQEAWHCFSSSRGMQTCMFPHATKLESLAETPEEPQIHVSTGEEPWGCCLSSWWGLRNRHRLERNPERPLAICMDTAFSWAHLQITLLWASSDGKSSDWAESWLHWPASLVALLLPCGGPHTSPSWDSPSEIWQQKSPS